MKRTTIAVLYFLIAIICIGFVTVPMVMLIDWFTQNIDNTLFVKWACCGLLSLAMFSLFMHCYEEARK